MKTIQHLNLQPKAIKIHGQVKPGYTDNADYHAEVVVGRSIRLWGEYRNRVTPVTFDLTFQVGDLAEWDSYNIAFIGRIVKIGPNTVTIKHYENMDRVSQLGLYEFARRNWEGVEAKRKRDANYMD